MNKHVGIMHIHVCFFLTHVPGAILPVLDIPGLIQSPPHTAIHVSLTGQTPHYQDYPCHSEASDILWWSGESQHTDLSWLTADLLWLQNIIMNMYISYRYIYFIYANILIFTWSNEKLVKTICSSFISNSPESVALNFESCMSCLPTSKAWICRLTFTPDLSLRSLQCCVHRVPRNFSLTSLFFRC